MKKYYLLLLLPLILLGQPMNNLSGTINYYYINRISDGSIINLPFRIADIKWQREDNALSIYSHLAMEYRIPSGSHFLDSTNPQDFSWDLRELYLSWQLKNGEISIGKKIHSWGSVDGNSPVDILNAYDYYYLFESGADQKRGAFSFTADFFWQDWKFGFSLSPIHNINRLPINDLEFPLELFSPTASQVREVHNPLELGGFITKSFIKGDLTLSYFDGYDRIFSPSGVNVWQDENNVFDATMDTIFTYRKTNVIGMGTVLFLGELTLRGDFAYFTSEDPTTTLLDQDKYGGHVISESVLEHYTKIRATRLFKMEAEYYQANLQFEYELPGDLQIAGQYIIYDTLNYSDMKPPVIDLPDFKSQEFHPYEYFVPGLGTSVAIISKNILLLDLTKTLYDNRLELSIKTMMDQIHTGSLIEMGVGYDLSESLKSYLAVNGIFGDNSQSEDYTFNTMEDFSHIRLELQYFY